MKTPLFFWLLLILCKSAFSVQAQNSIRFEVFTTTNTPALTTNLFTSIEATPQGMIWAGTAGQGLYHYPVGALVPAWVKSSYLLTNAIRDLRSDAGGVWVAQSGYTANGVVNVNGGVNYLTPDGTGQQYFGPTTGGLRTRNARSIAVDINQGVYVAHGLSITAGVSNLGGYSYKAPATTAFVGRSLQLPDEDGACFAVACNPQTATTWLGVDRSCRTNAGCVAPRIVSLTNGAMGATYGATNGLPVTNQVGGPAIRALCLDANNRGWVGFTTVGVYYLPAGSAQFVAIPAGVLPPTAALNPNGIKQDAQGNVFFCSTKGLLKLGAGLNPALAASYTLYTTRQGLPSDNITGIAFQYGTLVVWLASDAGLIRWPQPIRVLDPAPLLVDATGSLGSDLSLLARLPNRIGAAADGVTKLLLVAQSDKALTFALIGSPETVGRVTTLDGRPATGIAPIAPFDPQNPQRGTVVALYTAPDGMGSTGPLSGRTVAVRVTEPGGAAPQQVELTLVPPPVVFVHGMWSDPNVWHSGKLISFLRASGHTIPDDQLADYSHSSASTFDPLNPGAGVKAVTAAVTDAITNYQRRSIACAQVDVVAHSLGGIMTRSFSQQKGYKKPRNFMQGAVHRLITLGTPHLGSPLGPLLYDNRNDLLLLPSLSIPPVSAPGLTIGQVFGSIGNPLGQCHIDFEATSLAIQRLNARPTTVATHAIAGSLEPVRPLFYNGLSAFLLTQFALTHGSLFGNADNDLIVAVTSQFGGLPTTARSGPFPSTVHSGPLANLTETNSPAVHQEVLRLLTMPGASEFAANRGLPAGGAQPKIPVAGNRSLRLNNRPAGDIRVTAPARGATYVHRPATVLTLRFTPSPGLALTSAVFWIEGVGPVAAPAVAPYSATVNLPVDAPVGRLNVVALARDGAGHVFADTTHIVVQPNVALQPFRVTPDTVALDSLVRQRPLTVRSRFFNGTDSVDVNLSPARTGTRYAVAVGADVVRVNREGVVEAIKPGVAAVTVLRGTQTVTVPVRVQANFAAAAYRLNAISFPAIANQPADAIFGLAATSTSGDPITFSLMSGPATLQGSVLTITGAGRVTVKASQMGNAYYQTAADVVQSFNTMLVTAARTSKAPAVNVYPNPAQTQLTVVVPTGPPAIGIALFDVQGRCVAREQNGGNARRIQLDVSRLASGIYLLEVKTPESVLQQRIIKQ